MHGKKKPIMTMEEAELWRFFFLIPIYVTSLMHTVTPLTQFLQSSTDDCVAAVDLPQRQTRAKLKRFYGFMLT